MKNLVTIKFGSHLYGTDTPASDLDYKSVFVPTTNAIILQRVTPIISTTRPKGQFEKNKSDDIDIEEFALHRYLELLAEGQTVALDMLFAPENMFVGTPNYYWSEVRHHKNKFLSKKAQSFVGYCRTQANKYGIRGSRVHAVRLILKWFDEKIEKYGHLAKIYEINDVEIDLWNFIGTNELDHTRLIDVEQKITRSGGQKDKKTVMHLECCNRKTPFFNTLKDARAIYQRIFDEYGSRALLAEKNEGIDWKALSHAVRVGEEAIELFETGNITFPLVNRKHILDIKLGNIDYSVVANEIEELLEKVELASEKSTLPDFPDYNFIDKFVLDVYTDYILESFGVQAS